MNVSSLYILNRMLESLSMLCFFDGTEFQPLSTSTSAMTLI